MDNVSREELIELNTMEVVDTNKWVIILVSAWFHLLIFHRASWRYMLSTKELLTHNRESPPRFWAFQTLKYNLEDRLIDRKIDR